MAKTTIGEVDVYSYSLTDTIKSHALLELSYSAEKWALIGSWSAKIGPGTGGGYDMSQFGLGTLLDFEYLKKAVIMTRRPGRNKEWYLTGYDVGRLLDRTIPDPSLLPAGDVNTLVAVLCQKCEVPCSVTGGLASVADARAFVTATKVSDAIVELAQISGQLAYIDVSTGTLKFTSATNEAISFTDDQILEDGGVELDLDNYAKGVCVSLYRKKHEDEIEDEDPDDPPGHYFYGVNPPNLSVENFTGVGVSGTRLMPLNLPLTSTMTTTETANISDTYKDPSSNDPVQSFGQIVITAVTTESFTYDRGHRTNEGVAPNSDAPHNTTYGPSYRDYWDIPRSQEGKPYYNDNTQHREYKWVEESHTKESVITKAMTGPVLDITVRETVIEETRRTFDSNCLMTKETYSKRTTRELISSSYGNTLPDASLYADFAPKFDEVKETVYDRFGDRLTITETVTTNELQEVGGWAAIYKWNSTTGAWERQELDPGGSGQQQRPLTVKGVAFPAWVQHVTVSVDKEFIDSQGNVALRTHSVIKDGGSTYVIAKGWTQTVDADPSMIPGTELTPAQKNEALAHAAYAAFSSQTAEASVDMGGGAPSDNIIQSQEYEGVTWYWKNVPGGDSWYDSATGGYAQSGGVCPHYSDGNCNIADIDVIWSYTDRKCPNREGRGWSGCPRALAALENAKADGKDVQFAPPIVCHSDTYPASGSYEPVYFRNVYIRDDIPGDTKEERDAAAAVIGKTIANNLYAIKSRRGWVRTVTIPMDTSIHITGRVMSVNHNFKTKRTTLSYRVDGEVPDFFNPNSPSSLSVFTWERESNRNTRSVYGEVLEIVSKTKVTVRVGDGEVSCSSNIISLKVGDSVRVSLPAGNRMDGIIEERA
jgi:hypothetical protein